jgi:hypothetical protein
MRTVTVLFATVLRVTVQTLIGLDVMRRQRDAVPCPFGR